MNRGDVRIGGIIEARMGSTRLPGKVLREIHGRPMLGHVISRSQACALNKVIVATTTGSEDDPIEGTAAEYGVDCYRGSSEDVLNRVLEAAKALDVEIVVKLSGDNPLYHPAFVDPIIEAFRASNCDLITNTHMGFSEFWQAERTWPVGTGVAVFETSLLERIDGKELDAADREHVIKYIIDRPEQFRLGAFPAEGQFANYHRPELRFAVDTQEDLDFIRAIFRSVEGGNGAFGLPEAICAVDQHPELLEVNAGVVQRTL